MSLFMHHFATVRRWFHALFGAPIASYDAAWGLWNTQEFKFDQSSALAASLGGVTHGQLSSSVMDFHDIFVHFLAVFLSHSRYLVRHF